MPKKQTPAKETDNSTKDAEENAMIACLSYIWFLFLIPLFLKRKSKFAQHHAKQGLILFIGEVIIMLIWWFPIVGQVLFLLAVFISVMGIYKCLEGEYWKIPWLHQFAEKLNI